MIKTRPTMFVVFLLVMITTVKAPNGAYAVQSANANEPPITPIQQIPCTSQALSEAVSDARQTSSDETLQLASGCTSYSNLDFRSAIFGGDSPGTLVVYGSGATLHHVSTDESATLFLYNVTITGPSRGIWNRGTMVVENARIINNSISSTGGGVFNDLEADLTIRNSEIAHNHASEDAGGIYSRGKLRLENSTVSNNSAGDPDSPFWPSGYYGGIGIFTTSPNDITHIINSTITENEADEVGGIGGSASSSTIGQPTLFISNSVIAGNVAYDNIAYTLEEPNIPNYSMSGYAQGNSVFVNGDPKLEPLDFNGGFTRTHAPMDGSPLVGAGVCLSLVDQRFAVRPTTNCTIGAYEAGATLFVDKADVNNDGKISAADGIYVINRLGSSNTQADVDGNGIVNESDLNFVLDNLGTTVD